MEKETKKYLIIGGILILTVSVGVVLWKKYQTSNTTTDATATDQTNQDLLSLEASALASGAYGGQAGGAQSYSPSIVGSQAPTSLADEVLALERALGFAPAAPTTPSTPPNSGSASAPTSGSSPATPPSNPPQAPAQNAPTHEISTSELIRYNHGQPLFEMDGVVHEGVPVS